MTEAQDKSPAPRWLQLGAEDRVRFENLDGIGFNSGANTYLLQRLRLNTDITPASWLKLSLQAQDSRVFFTNVSPAPASQRDPLDLRVGFVQIGNAEAGAASLRAGRQSFVAGEGRFLGDPAWSNVGRTFDGLRAMLRHGKVRVDAFTGTSVKIYTDGFDTPTPGEHFHGLYGSIDKWLPGATIEPYVFWKLEHNVKGELAKSGNLDEKTLGLHWIGKLPVGFDYGLEMAAQRGSQAGEAISAWTGHWVIGHTLPNVRHRPRLYAEINRASGDQNPRDGVHGTFDQLFPAGHDKLSVTDLFIYSNIMHVRSGVQYVVRKNLTAGAAYNSFWLANRRDGLYSGSKLLIASTGFQGNHVGQEADVQAQWKLRGTTQVDLAAGHIFPGEFLRAAGHGDAYNSFILAFTQRF